MFYGARGSLSAVWALRLPTNSTLPHCRTAKQQGTARVPRSSSLVRSIYCARLLLGFDARVAGAVAGAVQKGPGAVPARSRRGPGAVPAQTAPRGGPPALDLHFAQRHSTFTPPPTSRQLTKANSPHGGAGATDPAVVWAPPPLAVYSTARRRMPGSPARSPLRAADHHTCCSCSERLKQIETHLSQAAQGFAPEPQSSSRGKTS